MRREELEANLSALGLAPDSYSLGCLRHSDCVSVVEDGTHWVVYYTERDQPAHLGTFMVAEDAYAFVYATFAKWLSTGQVVAR
jgi:hypothetical protein